MRKFLISLLIWLLILPVLVLSAPNQAQAAVKPVLATTFVTTPNTPQGQNGWYTSVVMISLNASQDGKTYFQWNSTTGAWTGYQDRFHAWRGENTLYYYSINRTGEKEAIKSQVIKVDYMRPAIPGFSISGANGQIKLSWPKEIGIKSYSISRNDGGYKMLAQVPAEKSSFVDKNVTVGRAYVYDLIAIDPAGNQSQSATVRAQVLAKVAKPAIDQKAATTQTVVVKSAPTKVAVTPKVTEEKKDDKVTEAVKKEEPKAPVKNWSRLLIAIGILILAAAAAVAGFYGYEWWIAKQEQASTNKKSNRRW